MRSMEDDPTIERLVTGERCDEKGCYNLGVWLVTFYGEASHWCLKHTRTSMRDAGRWNELASAKLGA